MKTLKPAALLAFSLCAISLTGCKGDESLPDHDTSGTMPKPPVESGKENAKPDIVVILGSTDGHRILVTV
jgi:hypothetical protein